MSPEVQPTSWWTWPWPPERASWPVELERLRLRLEADGLFEQTRKRPLPPFPKVVGVVTSPSGSVFHDIQNVVKRRFPLVELLLSPSAVQGIMPQAKSWRQSNG